MNAAAPLPLSDQEFAYCRAMLHELTGVTLGPGKKAMVASRLGKRLQRLQVASYDAYFRRIRHGDHAELQRALDLLTTHETYFFREPRHFEFLADSILAASPPPALRAWSAASSSGEEAYSLAMVLMDRLGEDHRWEVVGSDVSEAVLATARTGVYGLGRIEGLPPGYLRRFCLKGVGDKEGTLLIDQRLRRRVNFVHGNLKGDLSGLGEFDVVFLRNVLIYFDRPTKEAVVRQVARRLKPGGWFFVGHAESLSGFSHGLTSVEPTIYRKVS